jgi:hypothetical protein
MFYSFSVSFISPPLFSYIILTLIISLLSTPKNWFNFANNVLFTVTVITDSYGKNIPQKFLLDLLDKAIEITKSAGEN